MMQRTFPIRPLVPVLIALMITLGGCFENPSYSNTPTLLTGAYGNGYVILSDPHGSPFRAAGDGSSELVIWLRSDSTVTGRIRIYDPLYRFAYGNFTGGYSRSVDTLTLRTGTGWPLDSARWLIQPGHLRAMLQPDSANFIILDKQTD